MDELVELCVKLQSQYPRSPFEDYELLNSDDGLSLNIRNALIVTLEEKTVLQQVLDAVRLIKEFSNLGERKSISLVNRKKEYKKLGIYDYLVKLQQVLDAVKN